MTSDTNRECILSIVVPVYNTVDYLHRCVDSLLKQKLENCEIILIDDGSTDGSGEVCNEYARQDNRIVEFHQDNQGAAIAKNVGFRLAKGEYITTIDSDDYVDRDLYLNVIKSMEEHNSDMAIFGIHNFYENGKDSILSATESDQVLRLPNNLELFKKLLFSSLFGFAATKIFKREIVNGVEYRKKDLLREDLVFNLTVAERTNSILVSKETGYYSMVRGNSLLHNKYSGAVPEKLTASIDVLSLVSTKISKEDNMEISDRLIKIYVTDMIHKYIMCNVLLNRKEKIKELSRVFSDRNLANHIYYRKDDAKMFKLFTFCAKQNKPRVFYCIMATIWK